MNVLTNKNCFVIDLDTKAKIMRVVLGVFKIGALLFLLFFFVCSLDLLSTAFRLVGGRTTGITGLSAEVNSSVFLKLVFSEAYAFALKDRCFSNIFFNKQKWEIPR